MAELTRRNFLLSTLAAGTSASFLKEILDAAAAQAGTSADNASVTDVQLGLANVNLEYPGFIVASHLNLFKKYGVRPHVTLTGTSATAVQGLVSGSLNVASITTDSAILAEMSTPSIKIVQAITRSMPLSLVVTPDIKTPADLKGKTLGASNTTTSDAYIIIKMLEQYGLSKGSDYNIIAAGPPASRTAALQANQVQGIAVVEPQISQLVDLGFRNLIAGPEVKTFQHWPHICLMANVAWARANPTVLASYIKATLDGVRWTLTPRRRTQIISAFSSALQTDAKSCGEAYDDWVKKVQPYSTTGELPSSGLQLVIQSLIDTNNITAPGPNPATLYDHTWVHQAIKKPYLTKA